MELVVYGDGVELLKKENHYDTLLPNLQNKGVIIAQCENTLKERKINKDELWAVYFICAFRQRGNNNSSIPDYNTSIKLN